MLEPYERKRSRTVLRRERASNRPDLADYAPLVKAMGGLNGGVGFSGGCCGCMSGGACLISYITGKGGENDADLPGHVSALCHFTHWFAEEMKERYGGTDCGEILGGDQRRKMERCPEIMALSFEKCIEILSGKGLI